MEWSGSCPRDSHTFWGKSELVPLHWVVISTEIKNTLSHWPSISTTRNWFPMDILTSIKDRWSKELIEASLVITNDRAKHKYHQMTWKSRSHGVLGSHEKNVTARHVVLFGDVQNALWTGKNCVYVVFFFFFATPGLSCSTRAPVYMFLKIGDNNICTFVYA